MRHPLRLPLLLIALGVLAPCAAAGDYDESWERHYALLMKRVADMPAMGANATAEVRRRVERAQGAVPQLHAALVQRPKAWARAHGELLALVKRAPDDDRRRPLIGLLMSDPDAERRRSLDALLPERASAFQTVWILRLAEEGSRRAAHELQKRLRATDRTPDLALAAAWRAWKGDDAGRDHLLWALRAKDVCEKTPWVLVAAGLAAKRVTKSDGPWLEARTRLLDQGRRRLAEERPHDVRLLLACVDYAAHLDKQQGPRFFDLQRQVIRHKNVLSARWQDAEALERALRDAERGSKR